MIRVIMSSLPEVENGYTILNYAVRTNESIRQCIERMKADCPEKFLTLKRWYIEKTMERKVVIE